MKRGYIKRGRKRSSYSKRPRDVEFMGFVKTLPCCKCGAPPPSEAHHAGPRAFGRKADDRSCIPLCRRDHDSIALLNEFPDKAARRAWVDSKIAETLSLFLADTGAL